MKTKHKEKLLKFIRKKGIVRAKDLTLLAVPRVYLSKLVQTGDIERISRGLYTATDGNPTANRTLAQVSKRVPKGTVCLLSALRFHGLTTQLPSQVWIAIDEKARTPREQLLPLRIVRFSGQALTEGVRTHTIENVRVRVYSAAKTVADCFKYRNKIGLDVALEALRDSQRKNKCTMDELWRFARICRVANVMQPYLEAIV
jgi:predicted transcriptional regulator of viral defense system